MVQEPFIGSNLGEETTACKSRGLWAGRTQLREERSREAPRRRRSFDMVGNTGLLGRGQGRFGFSKAHGSRRSGNRVGGQEVRPELHSGQERLLPSLPTDGRGIDSLVLRWPWPLH